MIWLIACIASFVLGMLTGQGKLNWVRDAAGKARDVVLGTRPARTLTEVSPPPANKTIEIGTALKNVGAFLWGFLKNWRLIACIIVAVIIWNTAHSIWRFASCPMGKPGILWCVGQSNDAAELENERINTEVAQHETSVANRGAELAEETHRDARRREEIIAQAEQDFADAVSQADFDQLHSAYERATAGVWSGLELEGEPDHSPRGSDPVRRSSAHSA